MKSDATEDKSEKEPDTEPVMDTKEEVLSTEEARQWLDDFLVEHQKYKK